VDQPARCVARVGDVGEAAPRIVDVRAHHDEPADVGMHVVACVPHGARIFRAHGVVAGAQNACALGPRGEMADAVKRHPILPFSVGEDVDNDFLLLQRIVGACVEVG
jgi:hypothetical protein